MYNLTGNQNTVFNSSTNHCRAVFQTLRFNICLHGKHQAACKHVCHFSPYACLPCDVVLFIIMVCLPFLCFIAWSPSPAAIHQLPGQGASAIATTREIVRYAYGSPQQQTSVVTIVSTSSQCENKPMTTISANQY